MFPRSYFSHVYYSESYFPPVTIVDLIRVIVEGTFTLLTKSINAIFLEEDPNETILADSVTKSH